MEQMMSKTIQRIPRRTLVIGLACGGAAAGVAGISAIRRQMRASEATEAMQRAADVMREARRRAEPHITTADESSLDSVEPSLAPVKTLFSSAKGRTKAFADDVLGWTSKYKLIRGQHEEFLAEAFRKHFFGPAELKAAMMAATEAYLADLDAIDNRMLVDIRLDMEGLPVSAALSSLPVPDLEARYRELCGRISGIAGADLGVDAGRLAADTIVTAVIAMIATRMGTSAVVIGAGAANSWWTFGMGLVVGVIVDQIIEAAWNWTYDPRGQLVDMMNLKLEEVKRLVLNGDGAKPGLRGELRQFAEARARVRREAISELLATNTEGA